VVSRSFFLDKESVLMRAIGVFCLLVSMLAVSPAHGAEAPARTVALSASDVLKYNIVTITAKPGERMHIVLKTVSSLPKVAMAHNFVILKPGTDQTAFLNQSAQAGDHDYMAPALTSKVLVSTKMAGNGETVEATFTAPVKPGRYPYLCTFPGHFIAGMKGVLVVK
jgi:azurin